MQYFGHTFTKCDLKKNSNLTKCPDFSFLNEMYIYKDKA